MALQSLAVAVLELLARAAWTWVVTSHLLFHMNWHLTLLLASVGNKISARSLHLAHVWLALLCRSLGF